MDNVNKQEVWKDIPHYEGLYQISNLGNVWSINNNYLMKPFELKGYLKITLSNKYGKKKQERINRLVALAFLSNPNKYTQVNHIDENKLNNNVNNLECVVLNIIVTMELEIREYQKVKLMIKLKVKVYFNMIKMGTL